MNSTHGFALNLLRYFQCALCHDNLYTNFLSIKTSPEPILNVKNVSLYNASHIPQDASLKRLAEGLARFALIYIAGHEAGHIVLGHLGGADTTDELTWDEEEKITTSDFDQIAREVAADRFASQFLFNYLNSFKDSSEIKFMINASYQAVLSLFQFDASHKRWSNRLVNDQGTHPPAQFRSQIAVSGLSIVANEVGLLDVPNARALLSITSELAVKLHESVTGIKRTREEGEEYARFLPFVREQITRLFARHRELYPESVLENAAN